MTKQPPESQGSAARDILADGDASRLVARAMGGDAAAFDELMAHHRPWLLRLCSRLVDGNDQAQDLAQSTVLRAWLKRDTFSLDRADSFRAWLAAIARNLARRLQAREQPGILPYELLSLLPDPGVAPTERVLTPDHPALVEIERLPSQWRAAFRLTLEGYSYEEIADRLSISRGNVGVLVSRARKRLHERLTPTLDAKGAALGTGTTEERRERAWRLLEGELRGLVVDFRLVPVPVNGRRGALQLWIPVLDLARKREFIQQLSALERWARAHPDDRVAWRQLGDHHRARGDLEGASLAYRRAAWLDQGDVAAWAQLGLSLWQLERRTEAADALARALRVAVNAGDRAALEGHLCALRGDPRSAVRSYRAALSRAAALTPALKHGIRHRLAACCRAAGRPDQAIRHYEAALREDPNDALAYGAVADCYREMGNWEATVASLARAVEIVPGSAPTLRHFAQKLLDTEQQLERALELAGRAAQLAPESHECWAALGHAYNRLGRTQEADAAFRKGIEVAPDVAEAHGEYAAFLDWRGRYEEALRVAGHTLRLEPASVGWRLAAAMRHDSLGRREEALRLVRDVAAERPEDAGMCWLLASALGHLGQPAQAIPWAREAVRLSPATPYTWEGLGNALAAAGRVADAITAYEKAFSLFPDRPLRSHRQMYLAFGECCRRAGDEARARALVAEGVAAVRAWLGAGHLDHSAQFLLPFLLRALGDREGARASATRALALPAMPARNCRALRSLLEELPPEEHPQV